jgi:hypothetical protein
VCFNPHGLHSARQIRRQTRLDLKTADHIASFKLQASIFNLK